ncbi:hypothetical protein D3C72_2076890 [compost metagenome]
MQPVAGIPAADAIKQRARHQQQRTGQCRHLLQRLRRVAGNGQPRAATGRAQHGEEVRITTTYRFIGLAVFVHLLHAQQAIAHRTGTITQCGEGIDVNHQVGIDEGQPRAA